MKRHYVLPTSTADLDLQPWKTQLEGLGLDMSMLADAALTAVINGESDVYNELLVYVGEAVAQMFGATPAESGDAKMAQSIEDVMDNYVDIVVSAADSVVVHMRPYLFAIEDAEASRGTRVETMSWRVAGTIGDDVVIEVNDED